MKVKITDSIVGYDNQKLFDETKNPLTWRSIFSGALNAQIEGETLTADKKSKLFGLCVKLFKSDKVNITVDEASLIKERVGLAYPPLVYGRVCELFDGQIDTDDTQDKD